MSVLAVIWRAGGTVLATEARALVEVLPPLAWRPSAGLPESVRGTFVHRGLTLPLVDAAALLGAPQPPDRMMNRVLVIRLREPPRSMGLWVECVLDVSRFEIREGAEPAERAGPLPNGPRAQTRWGLVPLVGPSDLLTDALMDALTRAEAAA
jgi:chemotaxis signal transduction protein